jgi:hypothetical protein
MKILRFPHNPFIAPVIINNLLRVRNLKGDVISVPMGEIAEIVNDHTQSVKRVCALICMNDGRNIETQHEASVIRTMWLGWAAGDGGGKAVRS